MLCKFDVSWLATIVMMRRDDRRQVKRKVHADGSRAVKDERE
jgi:hypothetical protein